MNINKEIEKILGNPNVIKSYNYDDSEQTNLLRLIALNKDPKLLKVIKDPTYEMQLMSVTKCGWTIKYIAQPDYQLQLIAVTRNASNIQYIKDPYIGVQELVVNNNSALIKYIDKPHVNVQKRAIENSPHVLKYLKNIKIPSSDYIIYPIDIEKDKINLYGYKNEEGWIYSIDSLFYNKNKEEIKEYIESKKDSIYNDILLKVSKLIGTIII